MYRNLDAYLRDTLYIHQPLPLPEEGRLEEALAQKIPLERRAIAPAHALEGWRELGAGKLTISPAGNITLTSPTVLPQFPPEARDTHHTHYGVSGIRYDLPAKTCAPTTACASPCARSATGTARRTCTFSFTTRAKFPCRTSSTARVPTR